MCVIFTQGSSFQSYHSIRIRLSKMVTERGSDTEILVSTALNCLKIKPENQDYYDYAHPLKDSQKQIRVI